jgi:hypothetical protein
MNQIKQNIILIHSQINRVLHLSETKDLVVPLCRTRTFLSHFRFPLTFCPSPCHRAHCPMAGMGFYRHGLLTFSA